MPAAIVFTQGAPDEARHVFRLSAAVLLFAATTFSQPAARRRPEDQPRDSLQRGYANLKMNSRRKRRRCRKPTMPSSPPAAEVRQFGQVIAHVAPSQFGRARP